MKKFFLFSIFLVGSVRTQFDWELIKHNPKAETVKTYLERHASTISQQDRDVAGVSVIQRIEKLNKNLGSSPRRFQKDIVAFRADPNKPLVTPFEKEWREHNIKPLVEMLDELAELRKIQKLLLDFVPVQSAVHDTSQLQ